MSAPSVSSCISGCGDSFVSKAISSVLCVLIYASLFKSSTRSRSCLTIVCCHRCPSYFVTVTCVPAALCGYLDSIIDHRVDPCTDEEYHAPCRLISSSCCSERGHNRVTFDVLVRRMEGRKPSTQSVRPPSSQHQVSSDPSITRASEDKSKTDAKSVSIPSLTATFKSHRTGTAPEDRVREASHHFSEKDSEIRNAGG